MCQSCRLVSSQNRTASSGSKPGCPNARSEEHTSELQSQSNLVCRLLLEKKKKNNARIFVSKQQDVPALRDRTDILPVCRAVCVHLSNHYRTAYYYAINQSHTVVVDEIE